MKCLILLLSIFCLNALADSISSTAKSRGVVADNSSSIKKMWYSKPVTKLVDDLSQMNQKKTHSIRTAGKTADLDIQNWAVAQDAIITNTTQVGDYALVRAIMLLQGDNDVECWIESRGKRMLPILVFAVNHPEFRNWNEPERLKHIQNCIAYIKSHGKVPHCDW